jgi:hypothetical protein
LHFEPLAGSHSHFQFVQIGALDALADSYSCVALHKTWGLGEAGLDKGGLDVDTGEEGSEN